MNGTGSHLVCLVTLPPPVTGRTVATQRFLDHLGTVCSLELIDLAPNRAWSGWRFRLSKAWRTLRALGNLCVYRRPQNTAIYMVVNHGAGLLLDVLTALVARGRGYRLLVHHHVFGYLHQRKLLFALFIRAAPEGTRHLVLCHRMKRAMKELYHQALEIEVVPNLIDDSSVTPRQAHDFLTERGLIMGFLSNLTMEKGLSDAFALHERLKARGMDVELRLAGPAGTLEARRFLEKSLDAKNSGVSWIGPLKGIEKTRFLEQLDVFLFPSRYANEAQPLVVLEALAHGVPVIANDRGCIADMISGDAGHLVRNPERYAPDADAWLAEVIEKGEMPQAYRAAALAQYRALKRRAERVVERVARDLSHEDGGLQ